MVVEIEDIKEHINGFPIGLHAKRSRYDLKSWPYDDHISLFVVPSAHARVDCLCSERHINKYHAVE